MLDHFVLWIAELDQQTTRCKIAKHLWHLVNWRRIFVFRLLCYLSHYVVGYV